MDMYTLVLLALAASVRGQSASVASSCSTTLKSSATPSVAPGYVARLVANDLESPRGIKFDLAGNLLVIESGKGLTALKIRDDGGGCFSSPSRKTVVDDSDLNHGIEVSKDGFKVYASSTEAVYKYDYDSGTQKTTTKPQTLVTNMTNSDHTTRTLLLSRANPELLVVTRGSTSNIDPLAEKLSSGHSQIKAFNWFTDEGPYDFNQDGKLLGWGLRNDVGIDEHPVTGGLYSVENSVDEMTRNGVDIHQTNPGEELNFLGYLGGKESSNQGRNFGYPKCYSAWDVDTIPAFNGKVGEQFAIGKVGSNNSDSMCSASEVQDARLVFHPHMAPLDILFNEAGTAAWVTFHGSWDSEPAVGYKLSVVEFENGEPVEPSTSKTAAIDILSNEDVASCSNGGCFRPVGLAWNADGVLFMSSDETGEIYAILREDGNATSSAGSNATGTIPGGSTTASGTGSSASASPTDNLASATHMSVLAVFFGVLAYVL